MSTFGFQYQDQVDVFFFPLTVSRLLAGFSLHTAASPSQISTVSQSVKKKRKACSIIKDSTHPSHGLFILLPGKRYRGIRATTRRLLGLLRL